MVLFLGNSLCYLLFCFFFCCSYTNQKASLTNRFLGEKIGRLVKGGGGGLIKFIDNKGIIIVIPTMGNRGWVKEVCFVKFLN